MNNVITLYKKKTNGNIQGGSNMTGTIWTIWTRKSVPVIFESPCINMNPTAPSHHATIKLHKQNTLIRPIINWRNAPTYELAKYLTGILHNCLHLPNIYNIQNSIHLTTNLRSVEFDKDVRMCSFDTDNMYTNRPMVEFTNMIENTMENDPDVTITKLK
jgi:hypothetical protein